MVQHPRAPRRGSCDGEKVHVRIVRNNKQLKKKWRQRGLLPPTEDALPPRPAMSTGRGPSPRQWRIGGCFGSST